MKLSKLFIDFFNTEKAGGIILVFVTIISLIIANSPWQTGYTGFWNMEISGHTVVHWINDGFMSLFFLLVGLELEREIYTGELSNIKKASLPLFAALGGMLTPFALFFFLNIGTDTQSGAGIPMATDIAFAIGILSLLGNRVPGSLKIFLTALAVIDDLGAIIVIAIFYTASLSFPNLFIALGIFAILVVLNRLKVYNLIPYITGGILMWYFMLHSGVHATITGVLLAFAIPFGDGGERSPSYIVQHFLHKPVAFIILPLFALANTCIAIDSNWLSGIGQTYSLGIIAGLFIGKPLGIWLFSYGAVYLGLSKIPSDLKWKYIFGAGLLGGIGFTMSIFITLLAFNSPSIINGSKIAILIASFISGIAGYTWLNATLGKPDANIDGQEKN
jgi:Na+:H+ antiporter, NhaA family